MGNFDADRYAGWFNQHYAVSSFKSLRDIAKEISKNYRVSVDTISRLANPRKQGLTDNYSRPKIGLVDALSDLFKRPRDEGRLAAGYAPDNASIQKKPESVEELVKRLEEMGLDIQFDGDFERFTPDDLQELLDDIRVKLIVKSQRRMKGDNEESQNRKNKKGLSVV